MWWYLEMGLWEIIKFRWGPHDGISALIRKDTRVFVLSLSLSLPREDTARRWTSAQQKVSLHQETKWAGTLILDFPASKMWEINFRCWGQPIHGILYGSPNWLTQEGRAQAECQLPKRTSENLILSLPCHVVANLMKAGVWQERTYIQIR